mgnify:CR=1 FL=1
MILIISMLAIGLSIPVDNHDSVIPTKEIIKTFDTSPDSVRAYAHKASRGKGYSVKEWQCFDVLITRESHWHHNSVNGKHYGLGQVANMKKGTPVPKQLDVIFRYIKHRYGDSCTALRHSYRYQWY